MRKYKQCAAHSVISFPHRVRSSVTLLSMCYQTRVSQNWADCQRGASLRDTLSNLAFSCRCAPGNRYYYRVTRLCTYRHGTTISNAIKWHRFRFISFIKIFFKFFVLLSYFCHHAILLHRKIDFPYIKSSYCLMYVRKSVDAIYGMYGNANNIVEWAVRGLIAINLTHSHHRNSVFYRFNTTIAY